MKTGNQSSLARRFIGNILLFLAILLTADVVIVMLRKINTVVLKTDYQNIFRYELILCAILLLSALDLRFRLFSFSKTKAAKAAGWILRISVALLSALILFFCGNVVLGSVIRNAEQADYAIVLGMALENGNPTNDLLERLDTAQVYLDRYPEARLILTGGNPDESGRTEAAVMRDLLTERGISESRLLLEDQARTTKENFKNTVKMLPADEPVVLITSNYHMARAVKTAKNAGFTSVMRFPSPSGILTYGANMMWEVVHDLNDLKV